MTKSLVRVPNIPLATVYQRTARDGSTYLVGRLANAKIMIIETDRSSRGDKVWEIVIAPWRPRRPEHCWAQRLRCSRR